MQRTEDWLKEAEAEFSAAKSLLLNKHWAWCCFTSQQAAEKALKAIAEYLRKPQFGHNLNLLLNAIGKDIDIPARIYKACASLNRYYIPPRYPNAFDSGVPAEQFFEDDAKLALEDAQEVINFAKKVIKKP